MQEGLRVRAEGVNGSKSASVHPQITGQSVREKTLGLGGELEGCGRKGRVRKRRLRALERRMNQVGLHRQSDAAFRAWLLH